MDLTKLEAAIDHVNSYKRSGAYTGSDTLPVKREELELLLEAAGYYFDQRQEDIE